MFLTNFLNFVATTGLVMFMIGTALANGLPHKKGAISPELSVLCTNTVSGTTWQIGINLVGRTVDSNPAHISSSKISWRDSLDGGHYTLDRKSGVLTAIYASSTGGYIIHDRCTPLN